MLAARTADELDTAFDELEGAYWEAARQAPAYQEWLARGAAGRPAQTLRAVGA